MKHERDAILTCSEGQLARASGFRQIWVVGREAVKRLISDEAFSLAGNIAFRAILSIFPFLIFLTSVAGFVGTPNLADEVVTFLLDIAPREIVKGIAPEIRSLLTVVRPDLMSLGVLLTIWTASAGVDSLRVSLNRAYDLEEHRSIALLFVQNVLFVIVFAIVLMLFAFLIIFAPVVLGFFEQHVPGFTVISDYIYAIRYPVVIVGLFLALYGAHVFLPARWHLTDLLPGILLTIFVWLLLAVVYSYFLSHFATFASTYAGLAGVIIAIYFIYLSALVFIFGGEVNRAVRLCRKALEGRLGTPPSGRQKTGRIKRKTSSPDPGQD